MTILSLMKTISMKLRKDMVAKMDTLISELESGIFQQDCFRVQRSGVNPKTDGLYRSFILKFNPTRGYPLKKGHYYIQFLIWPGI